MGRMKLFHLVICTCKVLKWLLPAFGILLMLLATFFCMRSSTVKEEEEIQIPYNNETLVSDSESINKTQMINKTLMIENLNNFIQTPRKRLIEQFPGKYYTKNLRRNRSSVGLNVSDDFDSKVGLSNVFM